MSESNTPAVVGSNVGFGFTVGQEVRLRVNAWDPPSAESPGGLYGARGDKPIVAAIHSKGYEFPIAVHHPEITDGRTFSVKATEIEPW
mgnify:CR=1 FL=1